MRQRFEKRKTGRRLNKKFIIFWIICSFIFFLLLVFFYSLRVFEKKKMFVSPLSKQNQDQQIETINDISRVLKEKHIVFSGVFPFDHTSYLAKLALGEEVLFTSTKSVIEQVSSLQLILSRLTIEGKRVSRVDFRFDTPVLTMR